MAVKINFPYINSLAKRRDVLEVGTNLARYVQEEQIPSLIFLDRSARAGYYAMRCAWQRDFPDKTLPNIYFTNPAGYKYKHLDSLAEEIAKTYPALVQSKQDKLLLVDVCLHTGKSMGKVVKSFSRAGFQNILVGLMQPFEAYAGRTPTPPVNIDFVASSKRLNGLCNPFSIDWFVNKGEDLVSEAYRGLEREHGRNIRGEIKRIFENGL